MPGPDTGIPPPHRSSDELLTLIRTKVDHLSRRRRRVRTAAAAGLAVVLAISVAGLTQSRNESATVIHSVGPDLATPSTTAADAPSSTAPTGSPGPSSGPGVGAPPATTTRTAPPATAARPDPAAAHPKIGDPSTTTTTAADAPACPVADILTTATTDKAAYAIGEPIVVTTSVQNRSGRVCYPPFEVFVRLDDLAGHQLVGTFAEWVVATPPSPRWEAGEVISRTLSLTFAQCHDQCLPTPGTYHVAVDWPVGDAHSNAHAQQTATIHIG